MVQLYISEESENLKIISLQLVNSGSGILRVNAARRMWQVA